VLGTSKFLISYRGLKSKNLDSIMPIIIFLIKINTLALNQQARFVSRFWIESLFPSIESSVIRQRM